MLLPLVQVLAVVLLVAFIYAFSTGLDIVAAWNGEGFDAGFLIGGALVGVVFWIAHRVDLSRASKGDGR
jgi:hypothetical protein